MNNGLRFGVCYIENRIRKCYMQKNRTKTFFGGVAGLLAIETLTSFAPFDVSPNVSSRLEGPVAGPNRDAL